MDVIKALLLALITFPVFSAELEWDAVNESTSGDDLTGVGVEYRLYVKPVRGDYREVAVINGTQYAYNPSQNGCYTAYVTATRLDFGAESMPSNEVGFCQGPANIALPFPPGALRLIKGL